MRVGTSLKTQTERSGKTIAQGWTPAQLLISIKLQNVGTRNSSTSVNRFYTANPQRPLAKAVLSVKATVRPCRVCGIYPY